MGQQQWQRSPPPPTQAQATPTSVEVSDVTVSSQPGTMTLDAVDSAVLGAEAAVAGTGAGAAGVAGTPAADGAEAAVAVAPVCIAPPPQEHRVSLHTNAQREPTPMVMGMSNWRNAGWSTLNFRPSCTAVPRPPVQRGALCGPVLVVPLGGLSPWWHLIRSAEHITYNLHRWSKPMKPRPYTKRSYSSALRSPRNMRGLTPQKQLSCQWFAQRI